MQVSQNIMSTLWKEVRMKCKECPMCNQNIICILDVPEMFSEKMNSTGCDFVLEEIEDMWLSFKYRASGIKECPFCGGYATPDLYIDNVYSDIKFYSIHCRNCMTTSRPYDTAAEAFNAWNRRV